MKLGEQQEGRIGPPQEHTGAITNIEKNKSNELRHLLTFQLLLDAMISHRKGFVLARVGLEAPEIRIIAEGSFCDDIQNQITNCAHDHNTRDHFGD